MKFFEQCPRFVVFVLLGAMAPGAAEAQESGFLVLQGIPNGPAGGLCRR